jgi:hypothetical protein
VLGVLMLQLAFTYTPWMQAMFDTRSLPLPDLLLAPALGALLLFVLEAEKTLLRKAGWFDELKG